MIAQTEKRKYTTEEYLELKLSSAIRSKFCQVRNPKGFRNIGEIEGLLKI